MRLASTTSVKHTTGEDRISVDYKVTIINDNRFSHVAMILGKMVIQLSKEPSQRLLKHVVKFSVNICLINQFVTESGEMLLATV